MYLGYNLLISQLLQMYTIDNASVYNGSILEWMTDFLSGRTQRELVNGEKSNLVNVLPGVPQGTVLVPLLFFSI